VLIATSFKEGLYLNNSLVDRRVLVIELGIGLIIVLTNSDKANTNIVIYLFYIGVG
jgi:hypothetical protein